MTYTVRAQGRLADGGGVRRRSSCASNPDGSVVRLRDVARIELGALNYQQIGRVNGQPGCAIARLPGAGLERARRRRRRASRRWRSCSDALPRRTSTTRYTLDTTLPVSEGIREIVITLVEAMVLVDPRRLPVPAELARDADPD